MTQKEKKQEVLALLEFEGRMKYNTCEWEEMNGYKALVDIKPLIEKDIEWFKSTTMLATVRVIDGLLSGKGYYEAEDGTRYKHYVVKQIEEQIVNKSSYIENIDIESYKLIEVVGH